ncbi:MAG TPA: zinc ribbon domain-containing protein [Crenalkalicoccus sp.]|jgi:putative FmdB family regulatory protein|nr:zinc ribbon domain-containing protein [Crenalkalicoccus sp.]
MPFYDYSCGLCGDFEAVRPVAEAALPQPCPLCGKPAPRALSSPHIRSSWAGIRYLAESRNEKSAHEPMTEHRLHAGTDHHHHDYGHNHAHAPARRSHRPWMIGH